MSTDPSHGGRIRKALASLVAAKSEQERMDTQHRVQVAGATPIDSCPRGSKATVCGVLKSVSLRPRAGVPALEADLFDGSGHIKLVFLGRRAVAGIEPGRALSATGRITRHEEQPIIFNPRYQLLPSPAAAS